MLYAGLFDTLVVRELVRALRTKGSRVMEGFMRPEGVIVFHAASSQMYKVTCEADSQPKGPRPGGA